MTELLLARHVGTGWRSGVARACKLQTVLGHWGRLAHQVHAQIVHQEAQDAMRAKMQDEADGELQAHKDEASRLWETWRCLGACGAGGCSQYRASVGSVRQARNCSSNHPEEDYAPAALPLLEVSLELKIATVLQEMPQCDWELAERSLEVDRTVKPVTGIVPGAAAGHAALDDFLKRLSRYADDRNNPNVQALSGLSPWLHFGPWCSN
eukprot:g24924.t1